MASDYREATGYYLVALAVVCLIISPYIGIGSLVIWMATAMTMCGYGASFFKTKKPKSNLKSQSKPKCQKRHR